MWVGHSWAIPTPGKITGIRTNYPNLGFWKIQPLNPIYNKFHQRLGGYQFLCVDHELPHDFPMRSHWQPPVCIWEPSEHGSTLERQKNLTMGMTHQNKLTKLGKDRVYNPQMYIYIYKYIYIYILWFIPSSHWEVAASSPSCTAGSTSLEVSHDNFRSIQGFI